MRTNVLHSALGVIVSTFLSFGTPMTALAAEPWPTRPVKILVPFSAGGNTDIIARLTADRLTHVFKDSSFLVENQPGAGGLIVTAHVAKAAPDGYTLMMAASPQLVIAPGLQTVAFDPVRDFSPIKIVATNPFVLIVHKSLPATDLAALLANVKATGAKFSYASGSLGSVSHLASALLFNKTGLEATPVHYRGGAPAMNDVLAGHLPMLFANLSEALAQAANPDVRFMAVSGATRASQLPAVPTVAEQGIAGYELETFNGLIGPAGLSPAVVGALESALKDFVADKDVQTKLRGLGLEVDLGTSASFSQRIVSELPLWAGIITLAGARQ